MKPGVVREEATGADGPGPALSQLTALLLPSRGFGQCSSYIKSHSVSISILRGLLLVL